MAIDRLEEEFIAPSPLEISRKIPASARNPAPGRDGSIEGCRVPCAVALVACQRRDLAASILPGVPANGFFHHLATMDDSGWKALHLELLKRAGEK